MIEDKYLELIHKKIDGEITEKEKEELFQFLKANPEAEKLYNDLLDISKDLGDIGEIDPSSESKKKHSERHFGK